MFWESGVCVNVCVCVCEHVPFLCFLQMSGDGTSSQAESLFFLKCVCMACVCTWRVRVHKTIRSMQENRLDIQACY